MFAHTHRRSLSLLLPWTSLQAASILLILATPSTLKNPCMCHSQEHSQKPSAVPFSKISPVKVSVCLYYEKHMEMNTLSINIVYSSKFVTFFCILFEETETKEKCIFMMDVMSHQVYLFIQTFLVYVSIQYSLQYIQHLLFT